MSYAGPEGESDVSSANFIEVIRPMGGPYLYAFGIVTTHADGTTTTYVDRVGNSTNPDEAEWIERRSPSTPLAELAGHIRRLTPQPDPPEETE